MKSKSGSSRFNICPMRSLPLLSCPCSPAPASPFLFLPLHALFLSPCPLPLPPCFTKATAKPRRAGRTYKNLRKNAGKNFFSYIFSTFA